MERIGIRLPSDDKKQLWMMGKVRGEYPSDLVRKAIKKYIQENKEKNNYGTNPTD